MSTLSELSIISAIEDALDQEEEDEEDSYKVNLKAMQEESSKGKVKGNLLFRYISAGTNYFVATILVILFLLAQFAASGIDYWVNYYVNVEEYRANITNKDAIFDKPLPYHWSSETRLMIFGGGIVGLLIIAIIRSVMFYKLAMLSSKKLHHMVFDNILATPMRFFDTNPSGRILNRFSKDLGAVDEALPKVLLDSAQVRYFLNYLLNTFNKI